MEILDFINNYWTVIAGIGSTLLVIAYLKNEVANINRDMKEQKITHDTQITELKTSHSTLEGKFEENKDKLSSSINLIQQDIREIMTILKSVNK